MGNKTTNSLSPIVIVTDIAHHINVNVYLNSDYRTLLLWFAFAPASISILEIERWPASAAPLIAVEPSCVSA